MFYLDNGNCFLSKEFLAYGLAGVISEPYRQPYPPQEAEGTSSSQQSPEPKRGSGGSAFAHPPCPPEKPLVTEGSTIEPGRMDKWLTPPARG